MEKTNETKKKVFNADKTARQVEKSLESVFPKAKFFVRKGTPVEVLATDVNGYTAAEFDMFRRVFCIATKTDLANLTIAKANREASATPVATPAK
jgi:hypothetical protein